MQTVSVTQPSSKVFKPYDNNGAKNFKPIKIHEALFQNSVDNILELVRNNPDCVNEKGFNGSLPLHRAATQGNMTLVECFLNNGANVNAVNDFDETALHFACKQGSPRVLHCLLEAGADINAVDKAGRGAFHHATEGGSVLVLTYLVSLYGFDTLRCDYNRVTPLQLAVGHGHVEAIEYLLSNQSTAAKSATDSRYLKPISKHEHNILRSAVDLAA